MNNKIIYLICLALLLSLAGIATANTYTDADANDHFWNTEGNWQQGVPSITRTDGGQWGNMTEPNTICIIDSNHSGSNAASAGGVYPGCYGAENWMYMTGGELTCNYFNVGRGHSDTNSIGHFEMTGGTINTQGFKIPNQFDGAPGTNIIGHADLHGGTIDVSGWFHIGDRTGGAYDGGIGTMDITTTVLTINNDHTQDIQSYIDNGWITVYGSVPQDMRYYLLDYDITNSGKTTFTGVDPNTVVPELAWGPTPKVNALLDVTDGNVTISWHSGDPVGAYKHDVYFGTTTTPAYIGRQNEGDTDYIASAGQLDTTYYWKITEVNAVNTGDTYEGPLWWFKTADFLTVDDFDANDLSSNWTDTGSLVSSVVNNGTTMHVDCNAGVTGSTYRTPPQSDWDQQGLMAMRLSFYGDPNSDVAAELSVTVNSTTVAYDNAGGELQSPAWTVWYIPYSTLTGLGADLNNVTNIAVNLNGGGNGIHLDIDNIELTLLQCVNPPAGDLSGDCVVNLEDFAAVAGQWLTSGYGLP